MNGFRLMVVLALLDTSGVASQDTSRLWILNFLKDRCRRSSAPLHSIEQEEFSVTGHSHCWTEDKIQVQHNVSHPLNTRSKWYSKMAKINKYGNPCIMYTCHMRHTNTLYKYSMHWRSLRPDVPRPRSERKFLPYWQASRGLCKLSLSAIADFSSIGLRIWGWIWRFFPDRHIGELPGARITMLLRTNDVARFGIFGGLVKCLLINYSGISLNRSTNTYWLVYTESPSRLPSRSL